MASTYNPSVSPSSCSNCHKPTKYADFGRCVSDFFSRDFPSGQVKVEARTGSKSLFPGASFSDEFKVTATRDLSSGAITTEVKNTSIFPLIRSSKMGTGGGTTSNVVITPFVLIEAKSITTLTSNNLLTQQLTIGNVVLDGLKLDFTGSLQPNGTNGAKANIELAQGCVLATTTMDVLKGPILVSDLATRFRDFQLGGELGYDVAKGTIDKYSLSMALSRPREKAVLQALTGFNTFTASYHQKFTDQLEVAYRASWSMKVPNLSMEVGAKWNLLGGGFIKAKLDNVGRLGVALASDLRPGVQVTLGATVDTAKLNENSHKLGLELVYSV